MTPYDRVVAALMRAGSRRQGRKGNWTCPAHDDHEPSLSVTASVTPDGAPIVLVNCFAGCNTIEEVLPALGLEPADLFDGKCADTAHQPSVERFSPVRRSGLLALPPSVGRDFAIATTFARGFLVDGTFRPARSTSDIVGLILNDRGRRAFLAETGISVTRYTNLVVAWKASRMAHRCDRGTLCLFVRPWDACPYCLRRLDAEIGEGLSPLGDKGASRMSPLGDKGRSERHSSVTPVGTKPIHPTPGLLKKVYSDPLVDVPGEHDQAQSAADDKAVAKPLDPSAPDYDPTLDPAHPLFGYDAAKALAYLEADRKAGRWPPWDRRGARA